MGDSKRDPKCRIVRLGGDPPARSPLVGNVSLSKAMHGFCQAILSILLSLGSSGNFFPMCLETASSLIVSLVPILL